MSTQRDAHTEISIQRDVIQRDVYTERSLHIKMSAHKDVYIERFCTTQNVNTEKFQKSR